VTSELNLNIDKISTMDKIFFGYEITNNYRTPEKVIV